jgi:hypothetical protein
MVNRIHSKEARRLTSGCTRRVSLVIVILKDKARPRA